MVSKKSSEEIRNIVLGLVAKKINMPPKEIDGQTGFIELGIASLAMIELIEELEENFGQLPPTVLFNYPNIDSLIEFLSK